MTILVQGARLADHADRTFTFAEIGAEIGENPDTLRKFFNGGGLALSPPFDVVADSGGRGMSHRLHWRSVTLLLLAMKLQEFGFSVRSGDAARAAGAVFAAGLGLEHLSSENSPLIAVDREGDGSIRVALIERSAPAGAVEEPRIRDGFPGVGTFLIDPIGIGRVVWKLAIRQAAEAGEVAGS